MTNEQKTPLLLVCENPKRRHMVSVPYKAPVPKRCVALSCKHPLVKYDGRKHGDV